MTSLLKVDEIQDAAGKKILQNTGSVLQVVQKFDGAAATVSNTGSNATFVTFGNLSQTFTPTSSSSKVLLRATIGLCSTNTADRLAFFRFSGGNSGNGIGDTSESRTRVLTAHYFAGASDGSCFQFEYLDSPATTSQITYKVEVAPNFTNGNLLLNYYTNDTNAAYIPRAASCLTIMEISA